MFSRKEQAEIDATLMLNQITKQEALKVLFPFGEELKERIPFITKLRGKHPNLYTAYQAAVEWEGWLAMENKRKIDWDKLDPIRFVIEFSPSINGWRSNQAVEIAKSEPVSMSHSILDLLKGKK